MGVFKKMERKQEILEFIRRRFPNDNGWLTGQCYYFALILKSRFQLGEIMYDVINGHFVYYEDGQYYDWSGCINPDGYYVIWEKFDEYDSLQKERIIEGCIK